MKKALSVLIIWLVFVLLNQVLVVPKVLADSKLLVYSQDSVVIFACLILLSRTALARLCLAVSSLLWFFIVLFEWIREVGIVAMKQSPLLYDVYFLAGHLYILVRDLMGFKATLLLGGLCLTLITIGLVSTLLLRWVQRLAGGLGFGVQVICVLGIGAIVYGAEQNPDVRGRETLADARDNIERSVAVYGEIKRGVQDGVYADIDAVKLKKQPRVHIYIVESYGRAVLKKQIVDDFMTYRADMAQRFTEAGWHLATGLSEAPVMGGRSWLADATLLSGRTVKYESVYRYLTPQLREISSLPKFFDSHGYRTVLMRPKDKARPGIELVNHFGFSDTVFHEDLDYKGRNYGWVEIPDQFALGHIRDVVMPTLGDQPEFVFAHLGSSHIPWDDLPPIVDNWRDLDETGSRKKKGNQKLTDNEIKFQLKRFRRDKEVRLRRLNPTAENVSEYLDAIVYSLESVTRHILAMDDPPDLILIMGDHQPPMYKSSDDFSVPVHVLARDTKLLKGFLKHKFRPGIRFGARKNRTYHEGLYSMLIGALTRAELQDPPAYRRRGAGVNKAEAAK